MDGNNDKSNVVLSLEKHHKGAAIRKLRFADETTLVTAAKTLKLYDLDQGKLIRKIDNGGQKIYSLLVIDNFLLCTGDDEGCFKLWDYRVKRGVAMEMSESEDYISDFDIDDAKRIVLATSGEGTLSAFNIRAKRLEPPQSELFDAGFQAVRYLESKKKVVVGAEDGALNIFNVGEWGNISDRFPLFGSTGRNKGKCSADCIETVSESVIVVGCSDGLVRAVNILPNKVIQNIATHDSGVETVVTQPSTNTIASTDGNVVKLCSFEVVESDDSDSDSDDDAPRKKKKPEVPTNSFFSDLA